MFRKILIANRGEIACRIIKTAKRLGIETVAVYSAADRDGLHVKLADEAFCIGEPPAADSYLNIPAIIAAANQSDAEAIHPGYGFLSENADFARACEQAGIIFVGPSAQSMESMASKQFAKQLLEQTDVPLTPGYHGNDQSDDRLLLEAQTIGFPVLLKAAAGGGGKGMRAVESKEEFLQALAGARREARASFNDETMIIEKLITHPRHVEIQIMADNHGSVVHLFERDCSIQRRHQKIIEEAPAPGLSANLRNALAKAAITVAQKINYRGAGTIEFLVDKEENFYFMEMNTRLQVEHPVTEMITGLDLVEWQLRIAANETLPCSQEDITAKGHAIECRIYAEDPAQGFIPATGTIHFLREPVGEGVRLDAGVIKDSAITMHYDPMISKLISWGETRAQALQRMQQALRHYSVGGVKTNIPFLLALVNHSEFFKAHLSTGFLTDNHLSLPSYDKEKMAFLAASMEFLALQTNSDPLYADAFAWNMHLNATWQATYVIEKEVFAVSVYPLSSNQIRLVHKNTTITWRVSKTDQKLFFTDEKTSQSILAETVLNGYIFYTPAGPIQVAKFDWEAQSDHPTTDAELTAPMPATVVAVLQKKGNRIQAGDKLMILEAMKMEHTIVAPRNGEITDIFYKVGDQVHEGAELLEITAQNSVEPALQGS